MDQWEQLRQQCMSCRACGLADTRTNVVFGVGSPTAEVLLVGEAPGASEDQQGEPFVGAAGKLLDDMLAMIGLRRQEIYITNSVKCRPPKNRDPLNTEKDARAALITRGIAEIARLGVAMGCNVQTFAGLAGIGDLIVTATSMHSRNNRAGILIGKGETPENAVKEVGMVVEGINALPAAMELAEKYHVEMPIAQTVNAIVKEGMSASDALRTLMDRNRKNEMPQGYEKV